MKFKEGGSYEAEGKSHIFRQNGMDIGACHSDIGFGEKIAKIQNGISRNYESIWPDNAQNKHIVRPYIFFIGEKQREIEKPTAERLSHER